MPPDEPRARSRNGIRPEYREESIANRETKRILELIVSCERYGPHKTAQTGHAANIAKTKLNCRKDEIRNFIVRRLDDKKIPHEKIIDLMTAEGRSWRNFSRVGKVQGKNKEGETTYKNVSAEVSMVAFCAAAQLTNTPLENLIVGFLEYCDGDDNREGVVIPELIPHKDAVERLKREVREARSARHRANSPEPASDDSETYKDRLGRRIRGADKWLDAYNHDELPFVGRNDEQKRLDEFIKCSGPFKIWAIIAPSGAGKTRLMFQWVDTSPVLEGWHCRKLEAGDRDKPERWSEWSPDHPTLLIVDYMFGYERVLEEFVKRGQYFIESDQRDSRVLVRVLVIDHHMAEPMQNDKRWGLSRSGESLNFNERLFFDPQPLSLGETSDQEEVITKIIGTSAKLELSDPRIEEAKEYLRRTNAAWHPLFAALVGDAVKEGRDYSAWNRRELIKYYLKGKALAWEDQGESGQWAACLIAAATARRGLPFNDVLYADYPESIEIADDFEPIINICRKIIPNSDRITLPQFEPDLLGESFFLLFLERLAHVKKLRIAFAQMFIAESEDIKDSVTIELIGFLERLTQNLIIEENFHTEYLWQTLLDFLHPNNLPQGHSLRLAMNCCLINLALRLTESMPKVAKDLLTRVDFRDFPQVKGTRLLRTFTWHSMVMVELLGCFEGVEAFDALDNLLELWERNGINTKNNGEDQPLFFAIKHGINATVMMLLVRDRENLAATLYEGQTPLMCACALNNATIVNLVLDIGADIDASSNDGNTALMYSVLLGRTEMVSLLLKRKANVRVRDSYGRTALMLAAHTGKTEIVKFLLEHNIFTRDDKDNYGRTALMYSVIGGHAEMVSMLLRWDVDVHAKDYKDGKGLTALMIACATHQLEIAALLLDSDINIIEDEDNDGRTALMWACVSRDIDIIKLLLDRKANIQHQDKSGLTALMSASIVGHTEIVALLLERRASVLVRSNDGATALDYASFENYERIVEMLLSGGAVR